MGDENVVKETVTEVQQAPETVADKAAEHTPEPETPPVVTHIPDPPTPQNDGLAELRSVVEGLATAVSNLTELVTRQLPKDESPASLPWTHYGSKPREDS